MKSDPKDQTHSSPFIFQLFLSLQHKVVFGVCVCACAFDKLCLISNQWIPLHKSSLMRRVMLHPEAIEMSSPGL